ncbi:MAG: recombinase family protein [Eubacteriales bacterium]|nr:recombinase family protein [Eubacteriales bacterium]
MAEKIWNVAAYTRLSREDGDKEESNSIGSQKAMIRDFIAGKEDMVIVHEYVDDGYSGVNFERPGFKQMMEDIKAKEVDCIICKDLSRFARNYIDSGRYLEKIFPFMGVRFIAINDNYDSNGEKSQSDSLIIPFKNLINDAYCKDISMKIRSQLDIKRKMGDFIGSFCTYGYKKAEENKNKLLIDEEAARVVEMIFRLRLQGMSNSRIADKLNAMGILSPMEYKVSQGLNYRSGFRTNAEGKWNAVAIQRILTNELYVGTLIQHKRGTPNYKVKKEIRYEENEWIVIPKNHEPIVDQIDFDTVQSLLFRDVRVAPEKEEVHLFSGYVYCGDCGHTMIRKTVPAKGKKYNYLVCSWNRSKQGCAPHSFSEKKLEKIVFTLVRDHIDQICEIDRVMEYISSLPENQREVISYEAQITKRKEELQRYQDLKLNLYSDMADGIISKEEYLEFRAGYDRKIASAQKSIVQLQDERTQAIRNNEEEVPWIQMFKQYQNITELHRNVLVNLIERILVFDANHVEVHFRYQDKFRSALDYINRFENVREA